MSCGPILLAISWTVLVSTAVEAQLQSVPVYPHSALQQGATVTVDYGRDVHPASGIAQHAGARATFQMRRASVGVGAGVRDAGVGSDLQVAVGTGLRLLGGGPATLALGLQIGVGYLRSGKAPSTTDHVTLPLSVAVVAPEIGAGTVRVRPWLAPLVQLNRVAFAQVIVNQTGAGASAGADVTLPGRLGLQLGVTWIRFTGRRPAGVTLLGGSRVTLGAGARLSLGASPP